MISIKYIFLSFILVSGSIFGQNIDSLYSQIKFPFAVDSIYITGNDITDEDIILNELTFSIGDTINIETLKYNRERIYSLEIFTRVFIIPHLVEDKYILEIALEESWYIYPIPFFDVKEKDWDKLSYGLQLEVKNFRGRNEKIKSIIAFGYDPELSLLYSIPYLFQKEQISLQTAFSYTKARNKSIALENIVGENYDLRFIRGEVVTGKRLNQFNQLYLYSGFEYVEIPLEVSNKLNYKNHINRNPYIGFKYLYDTRDLAQFPSNGFLISGDLKIKGLGVNEFNYRIFLIDFRTYRELINDFTTKFRVNIKQVFGDNIPAYDYTYLGYDEKIRGRYGEKMEGNGLIISSFEVRYPILKEWNLNFDLPIIPKSLLTYRVGIYAELFVDAGNSYFRQDPLKIKNFQFGYGVGLTWLILPYNLARTIFAFNDHGESQFELILGTSF